MEEQRISKNKSQNIILENRERLTISGVEHVTNFNEEMIILETIRGTLTIKGNTLAINKLNLEDGSIIIEGTVYAMIYTDKEHMSAKGIGFLGKMFK